MAPPPHQLLICFPTTRFRNRAGNSRAINLIHQIVPDMPDELARFEFNNSRVLSRVPAASTNRARINMHLPTRKPIDEMTPVG